MQSPLPSESKTYRVPFLSLHLFYEILISVRVYVWMHMYVWSGVKHKTSVVMQHSVCGKKKKKTCDDVFAVSFETLFLIHFFRFLEEQTKKAKALENGNERETKEVKMEREKINGTPSAVTFDCVPKQSDRTSDGHVSIKCILKASPFLSTDGDENEEETVRLQPKLCHKDLQGSEGLSKLKGQAVRSARVLFDERVSQRQYAACSQVADRGAMTEDLCPSQKQEKMAGTAAAFSKRESVDTFVDLSADVDPKARKMASSSSVLSSTAQRRNPEREMFTIRGDNSPFLFPRTSESKINVRTDFLRESILG